MTIVSESLKQDESTRGDQEDRPRRAEPVAGYLRFNAPAACAAAPDAARARVPMGGKIPTGLVVERVKCQKRAIPN